MLRGFLERPTFEGLSEDPEDRVAEMAALAAIEEARERNERGVETLAIVTAAVGLLAIGWRSFALDARTAAPVAAVALGYGGLYAWSFIRRRGRPLSRIERWARTTCDVTAATVITVLNLRGSALLAMTSGAHYAYFLAVAISVLRLDPRVSIWATSLAVTQHLALYLVSWFFLDLPRDVAAVHPAVVSFRLAALGLTGTVGWLVARTLLEKTRQVATEALARERVRATFGSYVDERVVQQVLSGALGTGPERRDITVLFLDIRSFTAFAEARDPVVVFRCLHAALDAFSAVIQREGGIVNKFLGDGLLALFGAPETQPDHPRRAVRAALQIAAEAKRLADSGAFPELSIGIGVHTGEAMVGNLGGARREYTAIGDVVNVASRVEALNKELGTSILVTAPVRDALGPDAEVRTFPSVSIRGRQEPVSLFEVQRVAATQERSVVPAPDERPGPIGRIRPSA